MQRCAGCGKPLNEGDKVVLITEGKKEAEEFAAKKVWGVLHFGCFSRAVESPVIVLDEVKKAAGVR